MSGLAVVAHRGKEAKSRSTLQPHASQQSATTEPEVGRIKTKANTRASLIRQVCEGNPLHGPCGSKFEVISVIEAEARSDVVRKIMTSIKFVCEVLNLPKRPSPPFSNVPDGSWEDESRSDAYCVSPSSRRLRTTNLYSTSALSPRCSVMTGSAACRRPPASRPATTPAA